MWTEKKSLHLTYDKDTDDYLRGPRDVCAHEDPVKRTGVVIFMCKCVDLHVKIKC